MTGDAILGRPFNSHHLAAAILGFALGGFFDGILLHQVLQWHHFLSLVPGEQYQRLEVQIFADGLFHIAVYVMAVIGLLMLWTRANERPADCILLAWTVLGFSAWQFADVIVVHWIIGIHRIRVGVPNPLFWDLGWLGLFGITSLLWGIWLLGKAGTAGGTRGSRATALLSATVMISAVASLAPSGGSETLVLFRSDVNAAQTFAAAAALDAAILWSDPSGRVLVLDVPSTARTWSLYGRGALLVGSTGILVCLSGTRA